MHGMAGKLTAVQMPRLSRFIMTEDDENLVKLWLQGRSTNTRLAYSGDVRAFLTHAKKPLCAVTLGDLQDFADSLAALTPASQVRKLASLNSLFTFAHRLDYLVFNVGAVVVLPSVKDGLAERMMGKAEVDWMLAIEPDPRNVALLQLLYAADLRVAEAAKLRWRDLEAWNDAGKVTVYNKSGKTRVVSLPVSVWHSLAGLRRDAGLDDAVFPSTHHGGYLSPSTIHKIVKAAAKRAGLGVGRSAQWLRYAYVSHALDREGTFNLAAGQLASRG